ncbi:unnamed protein product [Musa textilis]
MGTEMLRPQDCLVHPSPTLQNHKPLRRRRDANPKQPAKPRSLAGGARLAMGRVTILRRGEEFRLLPPVAAPLLPHDMYAASGFVLSPSPRALPLPRFSRRKEGSAATAAVVDCPATRDLRRVLGGGSRWRVPDSVPVVGEEHEDEAGDAAHYRRQHHDQRLLLRNERRVEARHRVVVQQRYHREHHQREGGVDEVRHPQLVLGQVPCAGFGVGEEPQPVLGHHAVVDLAVVLDVAVGEGGEAAGEAADEEEDAGQVLVHGAAVACVGQERAEELEQEDSPAREEFDEVSYSFEGPVSYGRGSISGGLGGG